MECVALWLSSDNFFLIMVPPVPFDRERTVWRSCYNDVFERASIFSLLPPSPKSDISTFKSTPNLRNSLLRETPVSDAISVTCVRTWRSSIENDRLVHISI